MSGFRSTLNVRCCCWPGGGCGERGALSTSPPGGRRAGLSGRSAVLADAGAVGAIACETARAVEDGEAGIGVLVHAHGGLDEVIAVRLLRDLEAESAIAHAVVVADHALGLQAEDLGEVAGEGHERAAWLGGGDGEAPVVLGDIALGQEPVR